MQGHGPPGARYLKALSGVRGRRIVWTNVAFLMLTPLAAAVVVPWYVATHGLSWVEVAACLGLWVAIGLGVTAGYHRLFTHRAWDAPIPVRAALAVLGAAALENSVIAWAAAHRYHHRNVDTDDDPYNPQKGFFYSHMGWILIEGPKHDDLDNVPDLWKDPVCRWQHQHYLAIAVMTNLLITAGLALATGRILGMVVFALLLRIVLTHHLTFLINSAAHMWGRQPWSSGHSARDNWFLSFLTFGEGYHNYHHTFQSDYRNGALWYNWDPTKWLIWTLSRIGLAHRLRRHPVDVRLRRRFEHARSTLDDKLAAASATLDGLRARGRARAEAARLAVQHARDDAGAALAERLVAAEHACEQALAELSAVRENWQRSVADARRIVGSRSMRRRLRRARRGAEEALREWRRVADAYLAACTTPAAA